MPRNTTVDVTSDSWVQLTSGAATDITFQVLGNIDDQTELRVLIKGTVAEVAPTDSTGALSYADTFGEINTALSSLFPGISASYVWARALKGSGSVFISHA